MYGRMENITHLEWRLGIRSSNGLRRMKGRGSHSVRNELYESMRDLAGRYSYGDARDIEYSQSLKDDANILFHEIGPRVWPDRGVERPWLATAESDSLGGFYLHDLYYSEHSQELFPTFYNLVVQKVLQKAKNRASGGSKDQSIQVSMDVSNDACNGNPNSISNDVANEAPNDTLNDTPAHVPSETAPGDDIPYPLDDLQDKTYYSAIKSTPPPSSRKLRSKHRLSARSRQPAILTIETSNKPPTLNAGSTVDPPSPDILHGSNGPFQDVIQVATAGRDGEADGGGLISRTDSLLGVTRPLRSVSSTTLGDVCDQKVAQSTVREETSLHSSTSILDSRGAEKRHKGKSAVRNDTAAASKARNQDLMDKVPSNLGGTDYAAMQSPLETCGNAEKAPRTKRTFDETRNAQGSAADHTDTVEAKAIRSQERQERRLERQRQRVANSARRKRDGISIQIRQIDEEDDMIRLLDEKLIDRIIQEECEESENTSDDEEIINLSLVEAENDRILAEKRAERQRKEQLYASMVGSTSNGSSGA